MEELTVAVRFIHLTASMLLLGIFAFLCWMANPAARRAGAAAYAHFPEFQQSLWRIAAWSVATVFVADLAGFALQAAAMVGLPLAQALTVNILSAALTTQFGWGWLLRQGLLILLAGLLVPLLRRPGWR